MKTTNDIIKNLKNVYGNTLIYDKIDYKGSQNKITITCPIHGDFEVRYDHIIHGEGCPFCKKEKQIKEKWDEYVAKAEKIHQKKYSYKQINTWKTIDEKIIITCPKHGEFKQSFNNHVNQKQGCPKCYHESKTGVFKQTTTEIIEKSNMVHHNFYDYSKTKYNGLKNKMTIICPNHGEFEQVAYDHLRGFGCEKCKYDNNKLTLTIFIKRLKEIYGDKYDYSKVNYVNNHTKVCIICPTHGEFWQAPSLLLQGFGCPNCKTPFKLENMIKDFLIFEKINFNEQKKFDWLGLQSIDFYLPNYSIAIECQGIQHFVPIEYFGGDLKFKEQQERDSRKKQLCEEHGIKILYFSNLGIDYPYDVIEQLDVLKQKITE